MKKIAGLGGLILAIALGIFVIGANQEESKLIRLCTWSNYFSNELIEEFSRKHNIRVEVSYISSNEELLAKLKAGATGLDIIRPSDYMVRQMAKLGILAKLPHDQLPNISHLDPFYVTAAYDPGNQYSVLFVRGVTGIIANTEKVKLESEEVSWELLFQSPDPKHTSLLDDMREVFAAAFLWKGKSLNTMAPEELKKAQGIIAETKSRISMFNSEPMRMLQTGEVTIAHAFSIHGIQAHQENPAMKFFIPKEGGVIWTDNFAIPASSQHQAEALTFINHFLDPEVNARVIAFNGMASPNRTAVEKLSPELKSPIAYPPSEVMNRLQFMDDLGPTLNLMNRLWTEVKS